MKIQTKIKFKAVARVATVVAIMAAAFVVFWGINWLLKEFVGTWATWIIPVAGTGFILYTWYQEAKDMIESDEIAERSDDDEDSEDEL